MKAYILVLGIGLFLIGCGGGGEQTYSLLPTGDTFQQATSSQDAKIDILWMVDSSGSMAPHQNNLADNFNAFIGQFVAKGLDYHMAVASTDAWIRERNYNGGTCWSNPNPGQDPNLIYRSSADCLDTKATFGQLTHFRDGDIYGPQGGSATHSGTYLITSLMSPASVMSLFSTNIRVGIRGDGSERGFQSLRAVLRRNENGSVGYGGETHTALSGFRRPEAFLAVIVVADEEDQSRKFNNNLYSGITEYRNAFLTFLDGYTGAAAPGDRKYSVSSIVMEDEDNCSYQVNPAATEGLRYVAVSQATNGVVGNICSPDFSSDLDLIASRIASLATRFKLSSEPVPSSIVVTVNGSSVPMSATDGWTYVVDNGSHYIEFHGSAIPPQGATISVQFDPVTLQF
jgi:hypothetical protein